MKILKEVKSNKEKKLFIIVGILNFLITNSVLHLSLFFNANLLFYHTFSDC